MAGIVRGSPDLGTGVMVTQVPVQEQEQEQEQEGGGYSVAAPWRGRPGLSFTGHAGLLLTTLSPCLHTMPLLHTII